MENVVLSPTPDIKKVCDLLEQFIHQILEARDTIPSIGEYEASIESLNLLYLMIRNIEGVTTIAQKDLVLLPSAMNLTRSVFELSMKSLWMLAPEDAFDREVRWLAQLQTEEEYYERLCKRLNRLGVDNASINKIKEEIASFRIGVTNVLPESYKPLSKIPDLASMMAAIHEEEKYMSYIFLSQYSHGTHVATGLYRKGLGNDMQFGEYIFPKDWGLIFKLCWFCLAKTSERIFKVLGGDVNAFLTNDFIQKIQETIQRIETF